MEVEIDDAAVVSAHRTTASRFLDEQALDLLESASHGFSHAPLAPPPRGVPREFGQSVPPACAHFDGTFAGRRGRASASGHERDRWFTAGLHGRTDVRSAAGQKLPGRRRMTVAVGYILCGGVARRSGSRLLICRSRFDSERPHLRSLARAAPDPLPARLIDGPPSTSGQGHSPFKAVARVRIPLGAHVRAVSSVGRAPALQAGGRWFEPGTAHLTKNLLASGAGCCPRLLDRACPVWGRRRESRRLASPRWLASA
jgi:hypothetical protein